MQNIHNLISHRTWLYVAMRTFQIPTRLQFLVKSNRYIRSIMFIRLFASRRILLTTHGHCLEQICFNILINSIYLRSFNQTIELWFRFRLHCSKLTTCKSLRMPMTMPNAFHVCIPIKIGIRYMSVCVRRNNKYLCNKLSIRRLLI